MQYLGVKGTNEFCYLISRTAPAPANKACRPCCSMRPVKLLIGVDYERCNGSHVSTTVDGQVRAPFMIPRPSLIIVSPLPEGNATTRVCITLRAPCDTPDKLCYGSPHCRYALLGSETGAGCCAVDHV